MSEHPADTLSGRFAFGANWSDYARQIDERHIEEAVHGLQRMLGERDLKGMRFLDIGSGSGVHAVAALRLGAAQVHAIDFDPKSVEATKQTLERFCKGQAWTAARDSVFDLNPSTDGRYDVVYSWGVLHHTGDIVRAIATAASMVKPGGEFLVALYRKTPACGFWRAEKRWYSSAGPRAQRVARAVYMGLRDLDLILAGKSPRKMREEYFHSRGMSQEHDVHDWMGGYPYESISPADVNKLIGSYGFKLREQWTQRQRLGLFGSGCDEYAFVRHQPEGSL